MARGFGAVLQRLRNQAGITQEELERRSGVGVRTIRGLETGERTNPRMATVQRLADALALRAGEREELLSAAFPPGPDGGRRAEPAGEDDHASGEPRPGRPASGRPGPGEPEQRPAGPAAPDPLADAATHLAKAVAARWQREEEQRQIQDPYPLPVRWKPAPEELTDHWANICCLPAGAAAGPLDLTSQLGQIADTYRQIPSRRLVVLGRSGSGKTVLALRFVLDHLASRTPAEPVPVIFSIGAWNPTALTLRDWLTAQLTRDQPGLAAPGPGGTSLASALVESGRVLPVLDGFDEIADGLRRPALEALNATTLPLLLTSRPAEYAAAVAETDVLTSAAAIELTDLTLDDLAAYLPRTTRKPGGAGPASNAWDPVLAELRERPPGQQSGTPLSDVLATPLMVALARTIYSDTPDHDPAALLDTERFASPEELEDHLLDSFIPTVYRRRHQQLPGGRRHRGFHPERARYWLGYLAHHLTLLGTPDLAWWRLGSGLRRSTRTLVTSLAVGLALGLVDCAVGTAFGPLTPQIVDGAIVGLFSGLMFGLTHWLTFTVRDMTVAPSAVRLRLRGRTGTIGWRTVPRLVLGSLGGAAFGFGYGFVLGTTNGVGWGTGFPAALHIGLIDGILFGLVFGCGTGLTYGLLGLLETPLDLRSAVNPRGLLNTDRRTAAAHLLVWTPTFGLVVGGGATVAVTLLQGLLGPLIWPLAAAVKVGVISGLGGALGYTLTLTAWGQWAVLCRVWLPLTGRLPWSLITFLEDAYQRGVLRQAGAVYQFRHARLQHHLAHAHRVPRTPRRRAGQR
ncbi:helix-turn-helix domain-containing protein [Streptomyces sp. NPDC007205]|uniref:helix-turn-helix domain-containing protein n=1 Tax=Streptomyces sp. NPDC007205 TaxID=3154316 RepID=UPI0033FF108D